MIFQMNCEPRCTLAHDITNKVFAILAHCEALEDRIPSPWVFDETIKIKALTQNIFDMLRSPQCITECKTPYAKHGVSQLGEP